ncbi:MAG: P-loop NTPase [Spirulina sp.]
MPQIVAVHSFRHGTGKSSLIANLAVSIAREGYRVGAIDADVELDRDRAPRERLSGIYSYFALQKSQHFGDYIQGRATLAEIAGEVKEKDVTRIIGEETVGEETVGEEKRGRIYLFSHDLSRQGRGNCPEFSEIKILSNLLDKIIADFALDYLFLDLYPGLNETNLPLLALCDLLCLLLGLERADFQGTAVTLDVAKRLDIPHTLLLVNQVPTDVDRGWLKEQVALAYDTKIVEVLPRIDEMSAYNKTPNPFALCDRNAPHASEFHQIVRQILTETGQKHVPISDRPTGTRLSLLDLLDLPEAERHLFKSTLRQRSSTFDQILQQADLAPETVRSLLEDLLAKGLLKQIERNGKVYYHPYLTPKQGRKLNARIWDALTEQETD